MHASDELHTDRRLSDTIWARLRTRYDDARMIELRMLVGHYEMLAMTLNSLNVQPEHCLTEPRRRGTRLLQRVATAAPPPDAPRGPPTSAQDRRPFFAHRGG